MFLLMAVAAVEFPKAVWRPGRAGCVRLLGGGGPGGPTQGDCQEDEDPERAVHRPGGPAARCVRARESGARRTLGAPIGGGSLCLISVWQRAQSML